MTQIRKLYIFGDSFSFDKGLDSRSWQQLLKSKISKHYNCHVDILNFSIHGSAQDHTFYSLRENINKITNQDFVIIMLTHPSRYWYFLDEPWYTNIQITNLDELLSREQTKAIEMYVKYIQNPVIDTIRVIHRLTWLAYEISKRKLNKPIIIKCFDQNLAEASKISDLNISEGNLFDVQRNEFIGELEKDLIWLGEDPRFNHLCLDNHLILADKIFNSLIYDKPIQLQYGFKEQILDVEKTYDLEFVNDQLCKDGVEKFHEARKIGEVQKWTSKVGLKF